MPALRPRAGVAYRSHDRNARLVRLYATETTSQRPDPSSSSSDAALLRNRPSSSSQQQREPPPAQTATPRRTLPPNFGRNQLISVPPDLERDCQRIVATFKAPIRYAFGYGSGVFPQRSYDPSASGNERPLLDFVFAVSHPSHWHSINLQQNPSHYALPLRWFGSGPISWLQEKGPGAGVWFNVDVEIEGRRLKYGVVSLDGLCRDLLDWETLYLAGRMQKPIHILRDDARVRLANQVNLASALRAALLTLPDRFTERDLYTSVAGLSYRGDFRMRLGENPKKVENIVDAQLDHFRSLYGPLVRAFKNVSFIDPASSSGVRTMSQDMDPRSRGETARKLPIGLREKIETDYSRKWNFKRAVSGEEKEELKETDKSALWTRIAADDGFEESVARGIGLIVGRPTFNQSLKGILSAGPAKSLAYIGPKRASPVSMSDVLVSIAHIESVHGQCASGGKRASRTSSAPLRLQSRTSPTPRLPRRPRKKHRVCYPCASRSHRNPSVPESSSTFHPTHNTRS